MGNHHASTLFSNYRRRALKRGVEFAITRRQFGRLIEGHCYICGVAPSNRKTNPRSGVVYFYNGVDRVNNKRGYVMGNVRPCCWTCNNIKASMDLTRLATHLKKMIKGLKGVL